MTVDERTIIWKARWTKSPEPTGSFVVLMLTEAS
jgi:phosphatidylethanolamine-binding protein (PEBP) family uncharacterized protein